MDPPPPPTISVIHAGAEYTHGVIFESAKYNFKPVLQEDIRWSLFYSCMLAFSQLMFPLTILSALGWLVFVVGFGIYNSR